MPVTYDKRFKNNSLLLFSWWYTGLIPVSVHGYGHPSLPTWYSFRWPVTTEVGAWQLSQGWRWTRLLFPGLPILNPCWIIKATSSTVLDLDSDQELTQTKQRKLILTQSDNFPNRQLIPLHLIISLNQGSWVAVAYMDDFLLALC